MINALYDPLVVAARTDADDGMARLERVADVLRQANPKACPTVEDGLRLARLNLSRYVHVYPPAVADAVRMYYGL